MKKECRIILSGHWITAKALEQVLLRFQESLTQDDGPIIIVLHKRCKVMVDAAVRLLSLANQLSAQNRAITFAFDGIWNEARRYLYRANFFNLLSQQVKVVPELPNFPLLSNYQGNNRNLVEFKSIRPNEQQAAHSIPRQLTDALIFAMEARSDMQLLRHTAFTIFAELIDNIYNHSLTTLDGFAGLQVYRAGGEVQVVVSDSGVGLLQTARPKFIIEERQKDDRELVRKIFREGVPWDGNKRGLGLKQCAAKAIRFHARVSVRLANCSIELIPTEIGYQIAENECQWNLSLLQGTHVCFYFPLT
ncbi:MAG: ATP-binding protein [Ktedonobacteraceae bacterium]